MYLVFKRVFDVVFSVLGLVVLSPFFLIVAVLIKVSTSGPVFYDQTRIGQFGKPFRIWKFRTMVVKADLNGALVTQENDPRVTAVGRILRRTKLDELPQLWNVLKGDMSFVGPRPQVPRYIDPLTPKQREMLKYRPGITDIATLHFRNEEELLAGAANVEEFYMRHCQPKKIALNLQYGRRASLHRDIWIILQTIFPYWLGALLIYSVSLVMSFWLAYELRSDFQPTRQDHEEFRHSLPWIVLPQLAFLMWRGQLRGWLSYFSIPEMRKLVLALGVALVAQVALCYNSQGHPVPSMSIILMDFLLSFFTLCSVRMALRMLRERSSRPQPASDEPPRRVAFIGLGELATNLVLDFARSENPSRVVVAFFDDDPLTWGKRPHDIPVVGMPECLLHPKWQERIDEVIVTLPKENSSRIQEIVSMMRGSFLEVTIASGWPVVKTRQDRRVHFATKGESDTGI